MKIAQYKLYRSGYFSGAMVAKWLRSYIDFWPQV